MWKPTHSIANIKAVIDTCDTKIYIICVPKVFHINVSLQKEMPLFSSFSSSPTLYFLPEVPGISYLKFCSQWGYLLPICTRLTGSLIPHWHKKKFFSATNIWILEVLIHPQIYQSWMWKGMWELFIRGQSYSLGNWGLQVKFWNHMINFPCSWNIVFKYNHLLDLSRETGTGQY